MRTSQGHAPAGGSSQAVGQALVELALVTPILVILIMAIVQFAFVLETQMGLTNAVREAARRAAAADSPTAQLVREQLCGTDPSTCWDPSCATVNKDGCPLLPMNVQGFQASRLWDQSTDGSAYQTSPRVSFCSYVVGTITNYRVTVYVAYKNPVFFPLLSYATSLIDGAPNDTWDLAAEASMRLEDPNAPPDLSGPCP